MFQQIVILVLLYLYMTNPIYTQMKTEYVKMSGNAMLKYDITGYQLYCNPDCQSICADELCNLNLYLKLCNVLPLKNMQSITAKYGSLERSIKTVERMACGSFDNFAFFHSLDNDSQLECGETLSYNVRNSSTSISQHMANTTINVTKWTGDILVMGIIAHMNNDCVKSTIMWNIDVVSISSLSYYSVLEPTYIMLQTSWQISEDKLHFKDSPDHVIISNVLSNSTIIEYNYSSLYVQMSISAVGRCPRNKYLTGCWLECADVSNKHICNTDSGKEECLPGWFKSSVLYIDTERPEFHTMPSVQIQHCNMVDDCFNTTCNEACFSVGNGTSTCLSDALRFHPDKLFLRAGETVKCSFDSFNNGHDIPVVFSWQYITTVNEENEAVSNMIMNGDTLFVLKSATPSFNNFVKCLAIDASGNVKVEELRNYTIILNPSILRLNITLQHVYLGDYVLCYSNGWPSNFYTYSYYIRSQNSEIEKPSNIIFIEDDFPLGEMFLNCSVSYRSGDNETLSFYRMFRIYVYVMRKFIWTNLRKPIFFINDSATVIIDIKVHYDIDIIQLSGPTENPANEYRVVTFNRYCKGGQYTYLAMLYIIWQKTYIYFYRILDIDFFEPLTSVKLSPIIGYPYEMIYCYIKGYPDNLIKTNFTLTSLSTYEAISTNINQIRIPEDVFIKTNFLVECFCQTTIKGKNYTASDSAIFTVKPRLKAYQLNYTYIWPPRIITYSSLLYMYLMFLLTIGAISMIFFRIKDNKLTTIFETFIHYNHFRKAIRYNEKMTHMANVIMYMKRDSGPENDLKLKLFYTYLSQTHRCSYSPGFTNIPEITKEMKNKIILPCDEEEFTPDEPKNFYGIGPDKMRLKGESY